MGCPCFALLVPLLSWYAAAGAFPGYDAFPCGLAGAFDGAGEADSEAHLDWFSSQPEDFSGTGRFLGDGVAGLDIGEWSTPAAGGRKKFFRADTFSCTRDPSVFIGTFSGDFPVASRVAFTL